MNADQERQCKRSCKAEFHIRKQEIDDGSVDLLGWKNNDADLGMEQMEPIFKSILLANLNERRKDFSRTGLEQ